MVNINNFNTLLKHRLRLGLLLLSTTATLLPFTNTSLSEFTWSDTDRVAVLALKMSLRTEHRRSTVALDVMAVLYLMKVSISINRRRQSEPSFWLSARPSPSSVHWSDFRDLWLLLIWSWWCLSHLNCWWWCCPPNGLVSLTAVSTAFCTSISR